MKSLHLVNVITKNVATIRLGSKNTSRVIRRFVRFFVLVSDGIPTLGMTTEMEITNQDWCPINRTFRGDEPVEGQRTRPYRLVRIPHSLLAARPRSPDPQAK